MIEKEYKVILSKEQYDRLNAFFVWDEDFTQINYYYNDKDNYIRDNSITVRVREKNNKFALQTKVSTLENPESDVLAIKEEKEIIIDMLMDEIPADVLCGMIGHMCNDIRIIGLLKTHRKVCGLYENVTICLDYNEYLSKSDYELEIEYDTDVLNDKIKELFTKTLGIVLVKSSGKNNRFLMHICLIMCN